MPLTFTRLVDAVTEPETQAELRRFSCGAEPWAARLTNYLQNNALSEDRSLATTTWLAYDERDHLAGYVTLSYTLVELDELLRARAGLRRLRYAHLPALLLARLGVAVQAQGHGFGGEIVDWVRDLAFALPVRCRLIALHVDRANVAAVRLYERRGFFPHGSPDRPLLLMLHDLAATARA